jgi:chemotaxis methyl-accepting protein methylase
VTVQAPSERPASQFISPDEHAAFLEIVAAVLARTGIDFSRYRLVTVRRRIENRMSSVGARSFREYLCMLGDSRAEALRLLERLTIKVSSFYRNPAAFDVLRERVLPLTAARRARKPLRIWSIGCGRGEEPYTLAMLLEAARLPGTVLATDIDPTALAAARAAEYEAHAVAGLPPALAADYLERIPLAGHERYRVAERVRARVHFTLHDATSERLPRREEISDLICCRNVLIYLRPEQQERTLALLRCALAEGGYLWLGEAEWPPSALASQLTPFDGGARIFARST